MSIWTNYASRKEALGSTKREMWDMSTKASIARKIKHSLSYRNVLLNDMPQSVAIVHTTEKSDKKIFSVPGEHLIHGGLVDFANSKWLITELDADNEIYDKGLMRQCNHILRWIGSDGQLKEKWCVVEDGTKYLIGEKAAEMISVGDARIALTICKDQDTIELHRGLRFLIDDEDSEHVLAYQITKPNKLFNVYNGVGCFRFILNEVNLTANDNLTQRIADYTSWKPDVQTDGDHRDSDQTIAQIVQAATAESATPPDDKKGVWL